MKKQMTIREVRKVLFDTDMFAIINTEEMTNKQARDFFYGFDNQEKLVNTFINDNCFSVWYV
jgi:hypothetical protein